jgi:hypothetical protein
MTHALRCLTFALAFLSLGAAVQAQTGGSPGSSPAPAASTLQSLVINLAGAKSFDEFGQPANQVLTFNLGAGATVAGLGWTVSLTTLGNSWLSEPFLYFSNSQVSSGFFIQPGQGSDFSGSASFSSGGISDLGAARFDLGADGLLRLELYEGSDDALGLVDADYLAGSSITVQYLAPIPEPASMALMLMGLAGLPVLRRLVRGRHRMPA